MSLNPQSSILNPNIRIGHGFDVHRFIVNRKLVLGGVEISFAKGLAAHSDGDVVIHALCDALLGAAALGDLGQHFPDNAAEFENIDSRILLRKVMGLLQQYNFVVSNADLTVIAEQPKLAPYIRTMREILAQDLLINFSQINIKATTTEKLGFTGREEGIAAHAVALIYSK
jgi:2-C-methyl-D-erythritol 2,4-cyclodiphosphate synthase